MYSIITYPPGQRPREKRKSRVKMPIGMVKSPTIATRPTDTCSNNGESNEARSYHMTSAILAPRSRAFPYLIKHCGPVYPSRFPSKHSQCSHFESILAADPGANQFQMLRPKSETESPQNDFDVYIRRQRAALDYDRPAPIVPRTNSLDRSVPFGVYDTGYRGSKSDVLACKFYQRKIFSTNFRPDERCGQSIGEVLIKESLQPCPVGIERWKT